MEIYKNVWSSRTINGKNTVTSKMNEVMPLLSPCLEAHSFSEGIIAEQLGSGYPVEQTNGKVETPAFQMDLGMVALSTLMTVKSFSLEAMELLED